MINLNNNYMKEGSKEIKNPISDNLNKTNLLNLFFPEITLIPEDIYKKYPKRKLPEDAIITRIGPSPTGFMHIGTLYTALINERLSHLSKGGIFYLRIEDTDRKREIQGATDLIIKTFDNYNIEVNEGINLDGSNNGQYGPYVQSHRKDIYKVFIKDLFEKGLVYPCFCSNEELNSLRKEQEELKIRPGYYGKWAKWRFANIKEIIDEFKKGTPYVIRYRSQGNYENKLIFNDLFKGKIKMPDNDLDIVIQKGDGLPTYHFAHIVDDYLMGTTHVIRGDEWLSSTPLHYQLFKTMGWEAPKYGHLAPIQKMENVSRRKLSKRKDPEASMSYYEEKGYPKQAILEYLLNLASSDFEDWRKNNPQRDFKEFEISIKKLASHPGGALFDFQKLDNISKNIISRYSAEQIYDLVLIWAEKFDKELFSLLSNNKTYCINIFNIGRTGNKIRKDLGKWNDVRNEIAYFFEELFIDKINYKLFFPNLTEQDIVSVLKCCVINYNQNDSKEIWFEKIKKMCVENGFADSIKIFKENPGNYKGSIVDFVNIIRLSLTGRVQTPDLYEIMQTMGQNIIDKRLKI